MAVDASRRPSSAMQSFVMLDFEATGLFPEEPLNPLNVPPVPGDSRRDPFLLLTNYIRLTNPSTAPHIVEVSLISTSRAQIKTGVQLMKSFTTLDEDCAARGSAATSSAVRLPCNIHTRQVKPNLTESAWREYEARRSAINALVYSQEDLKEKNSFAVEWAGVKLFLEQLPKPTCIIAHNGIRFDFRLLYAELQRNDLLKTNPIPDEVYFVDSYLMFIDLEKMHHDELRSFTNLVDWSLVSKRLSRPAVCDASASTVSTSVQTSEGVERDNDGVKEVKREEDDGGTVEEDRLSTLRGDVPCFSQYATPKKGPPVQVRFRSEPHRGTKRRLFLDVAEDHPLQFIRTTQWSPAKKKRLRANLFQRSGNGDWTFDSHISMKYFREKGAFRLEDMYTQLLRQPLNAHFAQNDCEALMQICIAYGDDFLNYVDAKAVKLPF